MKTGITLIILAYNEESTIKQAILNYNRQLKKSKLSYQIIVVNDCSSDNTMKIISGIKKITILNNATNKGFAKSLKLAIKKSKFDNFFWIGGDNPNRNILKILLKFKFILKHSKNKFILIQYFKDLSKRAYLRKFLSNSYVFFLNFIFNKNIPYYNGQTILNKNFFLVNKLCDSRFILAQIILESLKRDIKVYFVDYKLNVVDKDKTSENLLKLIFSTFKDLLSYRLGF